MINLLLINMAYFRRYLLDILSPITISNSDDRTLPSSWIFQFDGFLWRLFIKYDDLKQQTPKEFCLVSGCYNGAHVDFFIFLKFSLMK